MAKGLVRGPGPICAVSVLLPVALLISVLIGLYQRATIGLPASCSCEQLETICTVTSRQEVSLGFNQRTRSTALEDQASKLPPVHGEVDPAVSSLKADQAEVDATVPGEGDTWSRRDLINDAEGEVTSSVNQEAEDKIRTEERDQNGAPGRTEDVVAGEEKESEPAGVTPLAATTTPLCTDGKATGRWVSYTSWQADSCHYQLMRPAKARRCLEGKWIHFFGDSQSRQLSNEFCHLVGLKRRDWSWNKDRQRLFDSSGADSDWASQTVDDLALRGSDAISHNQTFDAAAIPFRHLLAVDHSPGSLNPHESSSMQAGLVSSQTPNPEGSLNPSRHFSHWKKLLASRHGTFSQQGRHQKSTERKSGQQKLTSHKNKASEIHKHTQAIKLMLGSAQARDRLGVGYNGTRSRFGLGSGKARGSLGVGLGKARGRFGVGSGKGGDPVRRGHQRAPPRVTYMFRSRLFRQPFPRRYKTEEDDLNNKFLMSLKEGSYMPDVLVLSVGAHEVIGWAGGRMPDLDLPAFKRDTEALLNLLKRTFSGVLIWWKAPAIFPGRVKEKDYFVVRQFYDEAMDFAFKRFEEEGAMVMDFYQTTVSRPELLVNDRRDGVHYGWPILRAHARIILNALCNQPLKPNFPKGARTRDTR